MTRFSSGIGFLESGHHFFFRLPRILIELPPKWNTVASPRTPSTLLAVLESRWLSRWAFPKRWGMGSISLIQLRVPVVVTESPECCTGMYGSSESECFSSKYCRLMWERDGQTDGSRKDVRAGKERGEREGEERKEAKQSLNQGRMCGTDKDNFPGRLERYQCMMEEREGRGVVNEAREREATQPGPDKMQLS